jgi:hypothetical protein
MTAIKVIYAGKLHTEWYAIKNNKNAEEPVHQ